MKIILPQDFLAFNYIESMRNKLYFLNVEFGEIGKCENLPVRWDEQLNACAMLDEDFGCKELVLTCNEKDLTSEWIDFLNYFYRSDGPMCGKPGNGEIVSGDEVCKLERIKLAEISFEDLDFANPHECSVVVMHWITGCP